MNSTVMDTVFVGRQSIYNRRLDVVAYELLYRNSADDRADFTDGDAATSQVLLNTLLEIGLDNLVSDRTAYVNFTRNFLTGKYSLPFDKDRMVLEVLEDIKPDKELIQSLRRLADEGYCIALDDFVFEEGLHSLLEIAHVVKVDFPLLNQSAIRRQVEALRDYPVKLLAEKVETFDEFEFAKELGFDLFQGYFLSKPQIIEGRTLSNNRLAILSLVAKLQDPSVEIEEIEELVTRDVSLSYKLLRYINSATFGLRRKVDSIRQVVVLLGLQRLRTMVTLLMLAGIDDKPQALLETGMLRAKMCEALAGELGRDDKDTFFTVGLFSCLDLLMDTPMEKILEGLPLCDDVKGAILNYEGAMGAVLRCALFYERGEWDNVQCLNVDPSRIRESFLMAASWVGNMQGLLASESSENS